jgi:hypothetical protein
LCAGDLVMTRLLRVRDLPALEAIVQTMAVLGINRRTLLDWPGFQGLIDYRPMRTARDVYDRLHDLGVTHIAMSPRWPAHSQQEEVVFDTFLYRHARSIGPIGDYAVWTMPGQRPAADDPYWVLCIGVDGYADGLYRVERLSNLDDGPRTPTPPDVAVASPAQMAADLVPRADAVIRGKTRPVLTTHPRSTT